MSPNATSASSTSIIVEDGNSEPVKINCKPFFAACKSFLTENAVGKFYETYTMKKKDTEEYMNKPMRDMLLFRVEHEEGAKAEVKGARRFYWIYNPKDAKAFAEHVALRLKAECHEVFISPRTRFFFDIDLVLDEIDKGSIRPLLISLDRSPLMAPSLLNSLRNDSKSYSWLLSKTF
jgi:hypothetical protein